MLRKEYNASDSIVWGVLRYMDETQVTRRADGKWIVPPKSPAPITHANARSMAQKRWENYRRKAVERIVEEAKSIDPSVSVGADAFGLVAAKQFSTLMDSDKPAIDQLEKLGRIMTGQDNSSRENTPAPPGTITADAQALADLLDAMDRHTAAAVERSRAVDTDIRNDIAEAGSG